MNELTTPQKMPEKNDNKSVWELVMDDMKSRDDFGRKKYGTPLQANNGRDPLVDAYQEILDFAVYLRQEIEERKTRGVGIQRYVEWTSETAIYPGAGSHEANAVDYVIHGLTGEAGEIANKFKKVLRGDYKLPAFRDFVRKEIGDVMWYIARICFELRLNLGEILAENMAKLEDRKKRGVLKGSGGNR